jgi:AcrR family transcriptional regulator
MSQAREQHSVNALKDRAVVVTDEGVGRGRRDRILEAVSRVLTEEKRNATEIQAVVEDSALPLEEVIAEFPDLDDLVVAIASRQAARVTEPLRSAMQSGAFDDVRSELIKFGMGLRAAYSSVLIGFLRVEMTEGSRHKGIRGRFYEEGPAAVTAALCDYLDAAASKGKLAFAHTAYAAESLMGMLREPLYQELTVHSQEFTFYGSAEEAVEQAVDRFLRGCNAQEAAS